MNKQKGITLEILEKINSDIKQTLTLFSTMYNLIIKA